MSQHRWHKRSYWWVTSLECQIGRQRYQRDKDTSSPRWVRHICSSELNLSANLQSRISRGQRGNRKSGVVRSFGTRIKLDSRVGGVRHYEIRIIAIGREQPEHNAMFSGATRFLRTTRQQDVMHKFGVHRISKKSGLEHRRTMRNKDSAFANFVARETFDCLNNVYFSIWRSDNWCYTR